MDESGRGDRAAGTPEAMVVIRTGPAASRCKRVFDRCAAAAGLLLLAPLLAAVALLVLCTSGRPVLYRRRVLGLDGVEFDAFKFRTMAVGADQLFTGPDPLAQRFQENMKLRDDPRLTVLGRVLRQTSLDELPQLLNVLRGEMSLVGPRMIAPDELVRFGAHGPQRLSAKPGMTGLWQVSGRQELDYARRVHLDLYYIDHWSLRLDAAILLRTIPAVLRMRGAF